MSDAENPIAAPEQPRVEEAKELPKTPTPTATGNEKIAILKHNLGVRDFLEEHVVPPGLELAIRNVSPSMIATAIFEVIFYDEEGNIVEAVKHGETALEPETSRAILIRYPRYQYDRIKSYAVRLVRTTTADVEKVQLLRHEMRTTETGEEEIMGIVKNISQVKTDAAIVATFYDLQKENIGTKVVVLRDIEPHTVRQYELRFKPQEGDEVTSYTLKIGEIANA